MSFKIYKRYFIAFTWLFAASSFISNAEDGSALHQENCIACHTAMTGGDGSVLYTRNNRTVNSSEALMKQVNRCQSSLELNWTKKQVDAVHNFLNTHFYKF